MSPTKPRQRRKRDPESTRIAILEAARTILAQDGAEAMSVSRVANLAGVNRGTAYQHFQVKEDLIAATLEWVSYQLLEAVFEEPEVDAAESEEHLDPDQAHLPDVIKRMGRFTIRLAEYAVENWTNSAQALADSTRLLSAPGVPTSVSFMTPLSILYLSTH